MAWNASLEREFFLGSLAICHDSDLGRKIWRCLDVELRKCNMSDFSPQDTENVAARRIRGSDDMLLTQFRSKLLIIGWAGAIITATFGWFYFFARAVWHLAIWLGL